MDITEAIANLTPAVNFIVDTTVVAMNLFLAPPLVFFTAAAMVGIAFGLVKGFFRVKR
jgi:positive regulator of sigma E activity